MSGFKWGRIALLLAEGDLYASYYREALDHSGIRYDLIEQQSVGELGRIDVLIVAGEGELSEVQETALNNWVRNGGHLIVTGGTWGLKDLLGIKDAGHASNLVMEPTSEDRLWPEATSKIRFYGGVVCSVTGLEPVAECELGAVALGRRRLGKGKVIFIGPHIGETMALMQLGRSVECDGVGPPDGSARLDDGNLRAEDGLALDFERDRDVAGVHSYFAYPHCDALREVLIRALIESCEEAGVRMLMLWHWPRNAKAAGMVSLDCETFVPDPVQKLHRMLSMYGARALWLIGLPGYTLDIYRALRSWGHEVGLIFVTDDHSGWHEEKLKIQHITLSRSAALPALLACRPFDGKWRGYQKFYDYAENAGARLSVSKGGRQAGTSGFLFGTSHPFFPLRKDGSPYLIAELPYTVYMPGQVTPPEVCEAILAQTVARHGCFHFGMKIQGVESPDVSGALIRLLAACKQAGIEFLMPEELYRFERGRRALRANARVLGEEGYLQLISDTKLEGLTVMTTGSKCEIASKGRQVKVQSITRYGAEFHVVEVDVESKQQIELEYRPIKLTAKAA
jgi:hypothetical protein